MTNVVKEVIVMQTELDLAMVVLNLARKAHTMIKEVKEMNRLVVHVLVVSKYRGSIYLKGSLHLPEIVYSRQIYFWLILKHNSM